jgi:hypothetical protein
MGIITFDAPAKNGEAMTVAAHAAIAENGQSVIWLLAYRGSTLIESHRFDSSHEEAMFAMLRKYNISANTINKCYNSKFKFIYNPSEYPRECARGAIDKDNCLWFPNGVGIREKDAD